MHLKRHEIPNFWAIERKGTKYMTNSSHNKSSSVPLVIVLRDILKIVRDKKELKKLLVDNKVEINHKKIKAVNYPVGLFDVINLPEMKMNYKAVLSLHKKIVFEKINDKDATTKVYKVLDKKVIDDKNIQLNLTGGINVLSKEKVKTGDSVLFDLKEKKIIKVIKLEKGKKAIVVKGKHAGKEGKIEDIVERGGKNLAKITFGKEKINVWIKNLIVSE